MGKKIEYAVLSLALLCGTKELDSEPKINHSLISAVKREAAISNSTFNFESNDYGCIVYDADLFYHADGNEIQSYLDKGNIIAIADNSVDSSLLSKVIPFNTPSFAFDYANLQTYLGCYLFSSNHANYCVNVVANALFDNPNESDEDVPLTTEFRFDKLEKEQVGKQMIQTGLKVSANFSREEIDYDPIVSKDGAYIEETEETGKIKAFGFLTNLLYLEPEEEKLLCSYTIQTEVIESGIVKTAEGQQRIFDCKSKYIIDAEPDYAVQNYRAMRKSSGNVIDASYLQSNTSTTASLKGSISADSDGIIKAELSGGMSYTYNCNSQEISNDLKPGNTKSWKSKILDEQYNVSWPLDPSIRALQNLDEHSISFFSRVNELRIKGRGWWIFARHYARMTQFRSGLRIEISNSGKIKQDIIYG